MFFEKIVQNKTFKQKNIESFDIILRKKIFNYFFFNKFLFREQSLDLIILDNHTNYYFKKNLSIKNNLIKKGSFFNSKYTLFYHKFDKTIRFILPTISNYKINNYVKKFNINLKSIINESIKNLKIVSLKIKGGFISYSLGFMGFFSLKHALNSFKKLNIKFNQQPFLLTLIYKQTIIKFILNTISTYKNIKFKKKFTSNNKFFFILIYVS